MPYRFFSRLAGAVLDPAGRLAAPDIAARLGRGGALPQGGVWLHGASVGEIASAAPVIAALGGRLPVIVTANTATGRATSARLDGVAAVAIPPLDTPQAVARFLRRAAPRVAVTIENELWPNRSAALAAAGVPQVVLGARLSARSASRWARLPGLIGPMLARLDAVSAQDAASEARLLALGLPPGALMTRVNLKLIGPAQQALPAPGPLRARTLLAASTHEGEESLLLAALNRLRASGEPVPRLIVAPRHPRRFDAVAALMAGAGWSPARRSAGAGAEAPVLLADSMGEMALWYAAAGICLTGGSLVPRGGHTPWEPAAQACAILHGPSTTNAAEDYARLDAAGGARMVSAADAGPTIAALLADPAAQAAIGGRAHAMLIAEAGDPALLAARIDTLAHY